MFYVNGRASYEIAPNVDGLATLTLPVSSVTNKYIFVRYLGYLNRFQPSVSSSRFVSLRSLADLPSTTESFKQNGPNTKTRVVSRHPVEDIKLTRSPSNRRKI